MTKISCLFLVGLFAGIGQLSAADAPAPGAASMPMTMPMPAPAGNTSATPKTDSPPAMVAPAAVTKLDATKKAEVITAYMKIAAALAADNIKDAKTAAVALADIAGKAGLKDIASQATTTGKSADIAAVRASFKTLSTSVESLADGDKTYIVMYCPMAKADWIQTTKDVKNPYYGNAMLDCGGPKAAK